MRELKKSQEMSFAVRAYDRYVSKRKRVHTAPCNTELIQKLVRESFDQERFDYLKETFHQKMEFPWYVLIVTECRGEADKRETGYEFLKQLSKESGVDGFFTDVINGRSIGIFNTSLEYEEFIKTAETLKNRSGKRQFAISLLYQQRVSKQRKYESGLFGNFEFCGKSDFYRKTDSGLWPGAFGAGKKGTV